VTYDPRAEGALYPVKGQPRPAQRWDNLVCSSCGEEQETVFDLGDLQVKDGLVINVSGGYGMYVDMMRTRTLLLCGECLPIMRKVWPGLDQVLKEEEEL
jgi:hypothetical protein